MTAQPAPPARPAPADRPARRRRTRRTPTVLQLEAVECGAAALGSVLASHGRLVSLEELRTACGVSRDGARAASIVRAARGYGLEARGLQTDLPGLADVPLPAVLFWEFNHFVVYEGPARRLGRGGHWINDPAGGRRRVSAAELAASYTGVVLTFRPGPDFRRGGSRPRVLRDLAVRSRDRRALLLVLLAGLLLVAVGAAVPACIRLLVDGVLSHRSGLAPALVATLLVLAAALAGLTHLQQRQLLRAESTTTVDTNAGFLRRLLRLPTGFFTQRGAADLAGRVAMNESAAEVLSRDVVSAAISTALIPLYALLLWRYDPALTVLSLGFAALDVALLRWAMRRRRDATALLRADRSALAGVSYNGLQAIETLKAGGWEHQHFRRWSGVQARLLTGSQRIEATGTVLRAGVALLAGLNSALILLAGGVRAADGQLTVGALVAFQALVTGFSGPVAQLVRFGPKVQDLAADLHRLRDVERYPTDPAFAEPATGSAAGAGAGAPGGSASSGRLRLEGVGFGYHPQGPELLSGISFEVRPGERVALVGATGHGKSTIVRLIAGLHTPTTGRVTLDGTDCHRLPRATRAAGLAVVDQDILLFGGTVRDNLTLWDPTVPEEALRAALRDAALDEEIAARPGGLDAPVADGGRNFSGGQRQRLELARALVGSPALLVLDEATSALDVETEQLIDRNLRRRGCACVIVAHRLSTVRDSDQIIVLDRGRIVQRGRHEELAAVPGHYADLVREW
ncbi:NHLP family bacteriocin export ABC transporter peptidase/permease/ATPase subunit [Kitasatospora nipponensis]|uniref:NHLP family bacteriocin export ABC transporter peptidase/permease/ATPase subunit n=1 Tax=Kitasatospora nipponensis TaxID=258049 RepID=A0ABP4DRJ4_9ACTN